MYLLGNRFSPLFFALTLVVSAVSSILLAPLSASADFRVAFVDINKVLNESKEAQAKRKELDEMSLKAKKKVEEKRASLQSMEQKLKSAGVKEDSKEAENFRSEMKVYTRMVKDSEEEIKREFLKTNRALTEKALKAVRDYAKENNFDLVLDRGEDGRSPILYGTNTNDISNLVIERINR